MVNGLPDATRVVFDDARAVANAGVLLPAMLADRLGIEALIDRTVDLGDRAGAANAGRKVMTLVSAMALGADCIDDCDVLRSGQTRALLGHGVSAPSRLGTFLRAFTFGHVRQLDRVLADTLSRAWSAGAGPGNERLVVDVDSFVGEVYGYDKQGAGYGYMHKRGYHPIVATRSGTSEVLHIRARKGSANTSRGALRFVEELIPRVARAGATGPKLLRADSGFWNTKIMTRLQAAGWTYSIGVRQQPHIKAAVAAIPERDWQTLEDYPEDGEAQIAHTILGRQRLAEDLNEAALKATTTPLRLSLPRIAVGRLRAVADATKASSTGKVRVEPALSVKTQPEPWLLSEALELGFSAEVISADEARLAVECGFPADRLVLNGPAKLWPDAVAVAGAAFADSIDELGALGQAVREGRMSLDVLGPRVRPAASGSRFGCSVERASELLALARAVDRLPANVSLGLHLHLAASTVGSARWRRALASALEIARALDDSCRPVEVVDLGGGHTVAQLDRVLAGLDEVIGQLADALPSLHAVLLEPGKAISQPAGALFTRVLAVREGVRGREVVVDASIAELPQAPFGPHPVLWNNGRWWRARGGQDRVLGRLCMEADILADGIGLPDALTAGDQLVLGLAGAYDMSMSYGFGRG